MSTISELTHSHHEVDLLLYELQAHVRAMAAQTVWQEGGEQSRVMGLWETLAHLRAVVETHARFEELKVFPQLRALLDEPGLEVVAQLEAQHRSLEASLDFLLEGAQGLMREGRALDFEVLQARVDSMVELFAEHGALEEGLLDTTANLLSPEQAGGG